MRYLAITIYLIFSCAVSAETFTLYLIRHAEKDLTQKTDPNLTDKGRQTAVNRNMGSRTIDVGPQPTTGGTGRRTRSMFRLSVDRERGPPPQQRFRNSMDDSEPDDIMEESPQYNEQQDIDKCPTIEHFSIGDNETP